MRSGSKCNKLIDVNVSVRHNSKPEFAFPRSYDGRAQVHDYFFDIYADVCHTHVSIQFC